MLADELKMIQEAASLFPSTFGLRAFQGTFRISESASYVSGNEVYLYTQKLKNGEWVDFAKGTVSELKRNIVP